MPITHLPVPNDRARMSFFLSKISAMMLRFTLLEHTTANFLLELPFSPASCALPLAPPAVVFPSRIAFAAILHPATSIWSPLLVLFVSPPPWPPSLEPPPEEELQEDEDEDEKEEEEEEEEPSCGALPFSSESSEKGCMAGGGARHEAANGVDFDDEVSLCFLPDADFSGEPTEGVDVVDLTRRRAAGAPPAVMAGARAVAEPTGKRCSVTVLPLCSRALFILLGDGCEMVGTAAGISVGMWECGNNVMRRCWLV